MTEKQKEVIKKGPIKSMFIDFGAKIFLINGQQIGDAIGLKLVFDGKKTPDWTAEIDFDEEQHLYDGRKPLYPESKSRPHKQAADELTHN